MANDTHGSRRHEEHMYALHGNAQESKFVNTYKGVEIKPGLQGIVQKVLLDSGARASTAAEKRDLIDTAGAVVNGIDQGNPFSKQVAFISMMIEPLLRDKEAGFSAKTDPDRMKSVVSAILDKVSPSPAAQPQLERQISNAVTQQVYKDRPKIF